MKIKEREAEIAYLQKRLNLKISDMVAQAKAGGVCTMTIRTAMSDLTDIMQHADWIESTLRAERAA
jgi:hypothetical protein